MSLECQDLLRHMLVVEPARRYTLDQVIAHGWLRRDGAEAEYARFLDDVRRFSGHACVDYAELNQLHGHFRQMAITTPLQPQPPSSASEMPTMLDVRPHPPGSPSSPQSSARQRSRKRTIVAVTLDSLRQEQQQQSPTAANPSAPPPPGAGSGAGDLYTYHACAGAQLDAYEPSVRSAVLDHMSSIGISREQVFQVWLLLWLLLLSCCTTIRCRREEKLYYGY